MDKELNERIKAARARVTKYTNDRGACSFCHVIFVGSRADHIKTEQHQLAAEGVRRSMDTYQGEQDADDEDES